MSCPLAHSDGAYVLGALSPAERLEFERHLPGCETCRISVAQLAGLPGLLGRVRGDDVENAVVPPPLPDTVLPALVTGVRRVQRRRRIAYGLAAAAAVAAVGAGASSWQAARDDHQVASSRQTPSSVPSAAVRPMSVVKDEGITADVALTSVGWGTRVDLTCTYGREHGVSDYEGNPGSRYLLVIHTRDGQTEQVASWQAVAGKTLHMEGATGFSVDDIDHLDLTTQTGDAILRLSL